MVESDRQPLGVLRPQVLEEDLGLRPGVDEDERRPRPADQLHHRRRRIGRRLPGPGRRLLGGEHGHVGLRPRIGEEHPRPLPEPGREPGRVLDRRRQPDPPHPRRDPVQPREPEHQLVAALALGERMDLVDDHPRHAAEDPRRLLVGQHQCQRLGRRQQDVRRIDPLPRPLRRAGVPGAVLDPDRQPHLRERGPEVPPDVGGERLQRRDVDRVQPRPRRRPERDQARQEAGERLAPAGRRDEQRRGVARPFEQRQLVGMRLPAAADEPAGERLGQRGPGIGEHRGNKWRRSVPRSRSAATTGAGLRPASPAPRESRPSSRPSGRTVGQAPCAEAGRGAPSTVGFDPDAAARRTRPPVAPKACLRHDGGAATAGFVDGEVRQAETYPQETRRGA